MNKVIFNYKSVETVIQCMPNDKMKKIVQNFCQKTEVDINNLIFNYNGSIINIELEVNKLENIFDKERKIMNVLVFNKEETKIKNKEKSIEIICPDCRENARVNIKDYKFNIFGCKNGHQINNLSTNEFLQSQSIDISKITCEICKKTNKSECFEQKFHYCLNCKSNLCALCNSIHNKEHKVVKYEQKNYFCIKHFANYIKYCKQCKKNMCIMCENEHKNHSSIFFGNIIINKENYMEQLNYLKKNIDKFQEEINSIINLLKNISENINNYYSISLDIIKNYNIENLNYNLLKNIDTFSEHNKIISDNLNQIIKSKSLNKKFELINSLIQKNNNSLIDNLSLVKTIDMDAKISTVIPLNNKKDIAVCLTNGFLYIFDLQSFKKKLEANITNKTILDIVEFENNKICISCWDNIIRFIQLENNNTKYKIIQKLKGHENLVNCLKKSMLFKEQIILYSSSNDGSVLLWKYDQINQLFNKFKEFKIIEFEQMSKNLFLQIEAIEESIKYKKLICAASSQSSIYLCNLNNYSLIEKVNVSVNRCIRALKVINNDILLVAGNMKINVVNIKDKLIIDSIFFNKDCEFNCIFQKTNGNILISEYSDFDRSSKIIEFQFNEKLQALSIVSSRDNDFKNYITTIEETYDGYLISGGYNSKIIVFK